MRPFYIKDPLLIDTAVGLHLPATQRDGRCPRYAEAMIADHAALPHIHERHLTGGNTIASWHRDRASDQRRTITGLGQRTGAADRHIQQLIRIEQDIVRFFYVPERDGLQGTLGYRGHRHVLKRTLDIWENVTTGSALRELSCLQGQLLAASTRGNQTDAHFDQADIALQRHDAMRRLQ